MITAAIPAVPGKSKPSPTRDLSIDYLRTTLTLMVLAHHSSLAYTSWARFDARHIFRSTAPVVDTTRWAFFDYAENFNDVFFMSLMFFVSGLFVYPALRKHGTLGFIRDRFLRLGVPFAFAVVFLMPIAYYASWQLTGRSAGFLDFCQRLASGGFAAGPPWFVWVLLFFDIVLALLLLPFHRFLPDLMPAADRFMTAQRNRPIAAFARIYLLSALVWMPLVVRYGFGTWTNLITSPFSFQISRIGLYALWFAFGVLVGAPGFANGLLSKQGSLARRWPLWMLACVLAYNALWFIPKWSLAHQLPPSAQTALEGFLWVASCVASCFGFLALFRGFNLKSHPWMISLSRRAYIMYLVHYVFITWTQRLLLDRPIFAGIKFLFVFLATVFLSWITAQLLLRIPKLNTIL